MAFYLTRARPEQALLSELRGRLDSGEISEMRPFGTALHHSLDHARLDGEWAIWEEEDYCIPPLAQERAAVLDTYFTDLSVERVERGDGWAKIEHLPEMWSVLKE